MNTREAIPTPSANLEKETFFAEPTPIEQLIPGIDLTKLSTKEEIEEWQSQAYRDPNDASEIGRGQSDAFFDLFLTSLPGVEMDDDYVLKKLENWETALEPLRKRFGGNVLIDIGAGSSDYGYRFAQLVGASAYVAVDPFMADFLRDSLKAKPENPIDTEKEAKEAEEAKKQGRVRITTHIKRERKIEQNTIPWNTVSEDALRFVRSLPEKSVSLLMSGIRERVIPNERVRQIVKEVPRVLVEDGALLAYNSEIFSDWIPSELEAEKVLDRSGNAMEDAELYVRKFEEESEV